MRGAMRRSSHPADNDELDPSGYQRLEQAPEVRHFAALLDRRISSTSRSAAIIFRIRSSTVSLRFSRSNVRSTSFLYASMTGSGSRETGTIPLASAMGEYGAHGAESQSAICAKVAPDRTAPRFMLGCEPPEGPGGLPR